MSLETPPHCLEYVNMSTTASAVNFQDDNRAGSIAAVWGTEYGPTTPGDCSVPVLKTHKEIFDTVLEAENSPPAAGTRAKC